MRGWLFNVGYFLVAVVAMPFVLWRFVRHGKCTPSLGTKLTGRVEVPPKQATRVWLHAVSVGEVLQVRPLLRELRLRDPDLEVVLSTTTASGLKLAHEKYEDCLVVSFPFDFSWAVNAAFDRIQPDVVCLVELELWPNFIAEAQRRCVPLLIANGRLSEKSYRGYSRVRWLVHSMFSGLSHVCAQNATYQDRFVSLGTAEEATSVTGSIKFDGLATDRSRRAVLELRDAFGLDDDNVVFMAGSTHEPEESYVVDAWLNVRVAHPEVKLVLVPRHPERFDSVAALLEERGLAVVRRSTTDNAIGNDSGDSYYGANVVRLLDTVGELSACWGLADVAFVGGTLTKRGGQNMLEPAAYGCPVVMGPNVWNFSEIAAGLIDAGGAITVGDTGELADAVTRFVDDEVNREEVSEAARRYASSQCGAASATAERVLEYLKGGASTNPMALARTA